MTVRSLSTMYSPATALPSFRDYTEGPRLHFDDLPETFNEQVTYAVENYLASLEKIDTDAQESSDLRDKDTVKTIDKSLRIFFEEEPVFYEALKQCWQIPAVSNLQKVVLEFLKIDFSDLQKLFFWAAVNNKEAKFLLNCLFLDGFKVKLLKNEELTNQLFLQSIIIPDCENLAKELLIEIVDAGCLKAGLIMAIEQDKAVLALEIFRNGVGFLPNNKISQADLKNALSKIADQKNYYSSYQNWEILKKEIIKKQEYFEDNFLSDFRASRAAKRSVSSELASPELPKFGGEEGAGSSDRLPRQKSLSAAPLSEGSLVTSPGIGNLADLVGFLSLEGTTASADIKKEKEDSDGVRGTGAKRRRCKGYDEEDE